MYWGIFVEERHLVIEITSVRNLKHEHSGEELSKSQALWWTRVKNETHIMLEPSPRYYLIEAYKPKERDKFGDENLQHFAFGVAHCLENNK